MYTGTTETTHSPPDNSIEVTMSPPQPPKQPAKTTPAPAPGADYGEPIEVTPYPPPGSNYKPYPGMPGWFIVPPQPPKPPVKLPERHFEWVGNDACLDNGGSHITGIPNISWTLFHAALLGGLLWFVSTLNVARTGVPPT
jgi:hypothetical protein